MNTATAKPENKAADPAPLKPPAAAGAELAAEEDHGGTIQISENVIAAVVRRFTLQVDGVVRFASSGIVSGIAGMIAKRNYESSMVVDLDEDAVSISVTLVLRFGVRIPEVAQAVQDAIRTRVEDLTGKHVARVNVLVQDLEDEVPPPEEPAVRAPSADA